MLLEHDDLGSVTQLDLSDPGRTSPADTLRYGAAINRLVGATMDSLNSGHGNPNYLQDESLSLGMSAWMALRKHAIALHPLYCVPGLTTLGAGLTMQDLREPLAEGVSPFELLRRLIGEEAAERTEKRYERFLGQPYTDAARMLMAHGLDARQIRWRAQAAAVLAREAAAAWDEPLTIVSLACGAAGPVARLTDDLRAGGHQLAAMHLVDRDPVALAAGRAIARKHLDPGLVHAHLVDLVDMRDGTATDLRPHLGSRQAHLVDILGLFEYLPDETAISLLQRAKELLRPGGVIVLANMLAVRPEQDVFTHLIQWPPLVQRNPAELLALIAQAGFAPDRVRVATAGPSEAIYAVAALKA